MCGGKASEGVAVAAAREEGEVREVDWVGETAGDWEEEREVEEAKEAEMVRVGREEERGGTVGASPQSPAPTSQ